MDTVMEMKTRTKASSLNSRDSSSQHPLVYSLLQGTRMAKLSLQSSRDTLPR